MCSGKVKIIQPRKKEGKGEKQESETVKLTVTQIIGEEEQIWAHQIVKFL